MNTNKTGFRCFSNIFASLRPLAQVAADNKSTQDSLDLQKHNSQYIYSFKERCNAALYRTIYRKNVHQK